MAQPAESAQEPDRASGQPFAGAFPGAAPADCGKERTYALPDGVEFLSAVGGLSTPVTVPLVHARVSCSEEPGAGKLHAGICEGGTGQPVSLPRQEAHHENPLPSQPALQRKGTMAQGQTGNTRSCATFLRALASWCLGVEFGSCRTACRLCRAAPRRR